MTPGDVSTVTPQRVNPEDRTGRKMDRAWLPGYTPEPLHLPPVEPSHPDFLWNKFSLVLCVRAFPGGSAGKESACNVGDLGLVPGLGRCPGEGKGYPLQYPGLENSMDYTVHGDRVAKSRTLSEQLSLSKCFKTHLIRCSAPCSWLYIDKIVLFIKTQMSEECTDSSEFMTTIKILLFSYVWRQEFCKLCK